MVQINSFAAATEAACVILSIDETVRNPRCVHLIDNIRVQGVLHLLYCVISDGWVPCLDVFL
jgi:hypothetical protein